MSDYNTIARDQIKKRIFEVLSGKISGNVLLEQARLAEVAEEEAAAVATGDRKVPDEPDGPPGTGGRLTPPPADPAKPGDGGAVPEEAEPVEPEMIEDEAATAQLKQEILSQAALFEKGFDLIKESDAASIATAIYEATKAAKWSNLGTGAGTDEEGLKAAIKRIPTLMDLSFVSWVFEQKYSDAWSFTPTLEAVFESELDDRDMYDIVGVSVRAMPLISISGKKYTLEELTKLANDSVNLVKQSGFSGDTSDTALGMAGAATGAVAGAAAGTAAVGATLGVLGAAWGTSSALAGVAGAVSGGFMGATGAASAGMIAGATTSVAGGGMLASAGSGAVALLSGPPGWVVLGIAALGVGAYAIFGGDATMDEAVAGSMSSENYGKMQEFFKTTADTLKAEAAKAVVMVPAPEPEPEEEPEEEEGTDPEGGTEYAILPFRGLSQPYVKNIQIAMNEYCMTREISDQMIEEDGKWGPETQTRWETEFAGHVLDNHSMFTDSAAAANVSDADLRGKGSWKKVSGKLIGEFPGYNSTQRGMLAFCMDAYYDNTKLGDREQRKGSDKRASSGGGGGGGRVAAAATAGAAAGSRKPVSVTGKFSSTGKKNLKPLLVGGTFLHSGKRKKDDQIDKMKLHTVDGRWPTGPVKQQDIKKFALWIGRKGVWKSSPDYSGGTPNGEELALINKLIPRLVGR